MSEIQIRENVLDGRKIAYTNQTEFLVQIGKGKGGYSTRWRFVGNLAQAVLWFNGLNVHSGYKKRLLMPSCEKRPVLARVITH